MKFLIMNSIISKKYTFFNILHMQEIFLYLINLADYETRISSSL